VITDAILSAIAGAVGWLLSLFPVAGVVGLADTVTAVYAWMTNPAAGAGAPLLVADVLAPVHETAALFAAVFAIKLAGLVIRFIFYVISRVPFIGH
jgi:hypothetical protein